MSDLVTRLSEAAEAAIRNERPSLEHPVGHVRGVTIELVLTGAGQVHEAVCYVERRTQAGALLGRQVRLAPVGKGRNVQGKPPASVNVIGDQIVVQCADQATSLPRDSATRLRDQYSEAVFAHERQCGRCDLTYAYGRGSPDFDRNAAHYTRDSEG